MPPAPRLPASVVPTLRAGQRRALIADPDAAGADALAGYLDRFGIGADVAVDGPALRARLGTGRFDIVILDVALPGEDGWDACRRIRHASAVPLILVASAPSVHDRIVGLELGADDVLARPFDPRELVARIQSVLRRTAPSAAAAVRTVPLGEWQLDVPRRRVTARDGSVAALSNAEFLLLSVFLEHPRTVLSRDQLLARARGRSMDAFDRSIDLLVSRLRQKLGDDPRHPRLIRTVRGAGYMYQGT